MLTSDGRFGPVSIQAPWWPALSARSAISSIYGVVAARLVGMSAPGTVTATREVWETMSTAFDGEALGELEIAGRASVSVFGLRLREP
jgi:hypothetical protein